jgi:uncharacterized phage-associated protein
VAWQYGPVVQKLYHHFSEYGAGGIPADPTFDPETIREEDREYLDVIYDFFGQFGAVKLMELSHGDECWSSTRLRSEITHEAMTKCLTKYLADG